MNVSKYTILLLASYFVFGPVHSTIRGQIASSALIDNEYEFGEYLLLFYNNTGNELESIYNEINKLETTEIQELKFYDYDEKFRLFALFAGGLLLLELGLRNTVFRSFI